MIKNLTPAFTEAGKIKLGELGEERTSRGGGKYRMPVKLDEFKLTKIYRDASGQLVEDTDLMAALKDHRDPDGKLRSIPIVLHSDDLEEVFPTAHARYAGKKLHCHGDGEVAERFELKTENGKTIRTGAHKQVPCPCAFATDKSCKPHGILYCSIRVPGLAVAGAVHTFRTTSIISIQRLVGSLTQILKATGVLQGLPLVLSVQPVLVSPDGATSTVYCAHIELRAADIVAAQRGALETAQLRAQLAGEVGEANKRYRAMLKAPAEDEDDDEQAAVANEFHPTGPGNAVTTAEAKAQKKAEIRERLTAPAVAKQTEPAAEMTPVDEPPPASDADAPAAAVDPLAEEIRAAEAAKQKAMTQAEREAAFKAKHKPAREPGVEG